MKNRMSGDSGFGSIRKAPNLTAGLIETLVAQIESGDLVPGARLPTEQAIVSATGVSRTVVREALASLRARGLITTRQGLGAFVAEAAAPSPSFMVEASKLDSVDDVLQVLELRLGIEVEAAGLAAERRSSKGLKQIEASQAAFTAAIRNPASPAEIIGVEEDLAFHRAILAATGNAYFARVFVALGDLVIPRQRARSATLPPPEQQRHLRRIEQEHEAILAAIRAGDPAAARRAARSHLARSRARYTALQPVAEAAS
jgi:GntR family transcriptional repressor for pyruvate dehydrogenase complex